MAATPHVSPTLSRYKFFSPSAVENRNFYPHQNIDTRRRRLTKSHLQAHNNGTVISYGPRTTELASSKKLWIRQTEVEQSQIEIEEEEEEEDMSDEASLLSLSMKPDRNMALLDDYEMEEELGHTPPDTNHRTMILYYTPGVIEKKMHRLDTMMMKNVRDAAINADCVVILVDACKTPANIDQVLKEGLGDLEKKRPPMLLVMNKKDLIKPGEIAKKLQWYEKFTDVDEVIPVSAKYGHGVEDVKEWILSKLPFGPPYYPKDIVSEHPERFFVAEIVREKIFMQYRNEVPYACQVNVLSYKTRPAAKDFIQEGKALKTLATAARLDIEDFLQKKVFLEVEVRVKENWRQDEGLLKYYGYGGQIRAIYLKLGADAFSRDGFVRTKGVQFSLNGYPYYANGFNAYWLMYVASDPSQRPKISAAFQEASRHGLTVARTWAFSDGGYRPLQYSPGSYNEDMFQGLDFAIAEARRHGIKIILSFANNYVSFGGKKQYVDWARSRGRPVSSEDDFFTDFLVKDFYKNHMKAVLNRFNTFTKVHYRDDPTIMAWELMNEPRCPSDPTGRTIQAWITEMAAHVKSLDRNHLLEAGLEGFYGQSSPQSKTLNPPGQFGTDFIANNRIPGIDFVTVHSYPDEWFVDSNEQSQMEFLNKWLDAHIQDAQNVLHKPIILAEFGKSTKKAGSAQRDAVFNTVYGKIYDSAKRGGAAAGGLFWQLLGNGMDNFQDGYGIILSQSSSTVNVIAQQSRKLTLIRRIFARMINVEKWKRARGYGPVRKGASVEKRASLVSNQLNDQLKTLVGSGKLRDARQVFDKMPHRDVYSWTTIIQGYIAATNYDEALLLFSAMHVDDARVSADSHVLSVALKACGQTSNISFGESLHAFAHKTHLLSDVYVASSLLNLYKGNGMIDKSCRLFSELPYRNTVTWTTIITGLVHAGRHKEGLMYTECGEMQDGLRLFESMRERDVVSWTSLITAYSRIGQEENAVKTFLEMRNSDVPPNEQTFASAFAACASLSRLVCGEQLHGMRCRDIISWSTIIGGYSQAGFAEEGFEYFSWMRRSGTKPTDFALASLLSVSGNMAVLEQGRQVHALALYLGLEQSPT
ncbi:hypothetical protein F2Q70_00031210 [Brassica cretica]|nr:hypothetical protein F2Q70_00031210 [Brassica cretica]